MTPRTSRSASGGTVEGVSWIEDGIRDYRAIGAMVGLPVLPVLLGIKAEALHLADRTFEALEAVREAESERELGICFHKSPWTSVKNYHGRWLNSPALPRLTANLERARDLLAWLSCWRYASSW
jgi:hypothetical protein